jgi:hypothetical protein
MSRPRAHCRKDRRGCTGPDVLPADLFDHARKPAPRVGRPPKPNLSTWRVSDDWPDRVPVTEAELDVFEGHFGPLLDELLGSKN